jgi:hypothetical protein
LYQTLHETANNDQTAQATMKCNFIPSPKDKTDYTPRRKQQPATIKQTTMDELMNQGGGSVGASDQHKKMKQGTARTAQKQAPKNLQQEQ